MDEGTYLHYSDREELARKLFQLENVNHDEGIHYCGKMHSELFGGDMQVYHHEKGSSVFLTKDYIILIGKKEHNQATKKSLENKLGITLK